MLFHDFECNKCGNIDEDVPFENHHSIEREVDCSKCGGVASMLFSRRNFLHQNHSGMYGKWHDGFGCVVESYSHKQSLLKKYNVIESADPVGGSRNHIGADVTSPNQTKAEGPQWSFGGSPKEAIEAAQRQMEE